MWIGRAALYLVSWITGWATPISSCLLPFSTKSFWFDISEATLFSTSAVGDRDALFCWLCLIRLMSGIVDEPVWPSFATAKAILGLSWINWITSDICSMNDATCPVIRNSRSTCKQKPERKHRTHSKVQILKENFCIRPTQNRRNAKERLPNRDTGSSTRLTAHGTLTRFWAISVGWSRTRLNLKETIDCWVVSSWHSTNSPSGSTLMNVSLGNSKSLFLRLHRSRLFCFSKGVTPDETVAPEVPHSRSLQWGEN